MEKEMKLRQTILEKITDIYILFVIVIFPMIVDKTGFFKILECKYNTFVLGSSAYIIALICTIIYFKVVYKQRIIQSRKIKLSKVQICILIFLGINIVSFFLSPYSKNYSLIIGMGRGEGILVQILYILSFLFITMFGKFKKEHILLFAISSIIFNFVALLQFFGFNPFNMFQDGIGTHNVSFMGTIGNVDFISAYFCIVLTISVAAYVFLNNKRAHNSVYLISIFMAYMIFQVINVNSSRVGFIVTILLFAPLMILDSKRLAKLLKVVSVVMLAYFANLFLNPEYHYDVGSIKLYLNFSLLPLAFLILCAIFYVLSKLMEKCEFNLITKKSLLIFYTLLVVVTMLVLVAIYMYNFSPRFGAVYELHQLMHGDFNDEYGTYRIFLFKRALKLIGDYPILGTGPDTFAARFMPKYSEDIVSLGNGLTINDTSGNVYITMCVNIGILGLCMYIIFLALLFIKSIKAIKNKNIYTIVLLAGCVCYIVQDFFNLWVVIVTPIYFVTLALLHASTYIKEKVKL